MGTLSKISLGYRYGIWDFWRVPLYLRYVSLGITNPGDNILDRVIDPYLPTFSIPILQDIVIPLTIFYYFLGD